MKAIHVLILPVFHCLHLYLFFGNRLNNTQYFNKNVIKKYKIYTHIKRGQVTFKEGSNNNIDIK